MEPTTDPFTALANRLFASWRTTLLALLCIGTILLLGFGKIVEWPHLWGWLSGPALLLLFKDPKVVRKEKALAVKKALNAADCTPDPTMTPGHSRR